MKRIDKPGARDRISGITLIEVMIALVILLFATYFIFEVLITSYSQLTKLKCKSKLAALASSKIEDILYQGAVTEDSSWHPYPHDPEYWYQVSVNEIYMNDLFPNYLMTRVTLESKGPVGRVNRPEYHIAVGTVLLNYTSNVSTTREKRWGESMSREVDGE